MLTPRDQSILELVQNYGFVTTRIISESHFKGIAITTVLRRLRKLEANTWLRQITMRGYQDRYWMLTKRSALLFEKPSMTVLPFFYFDHDVKVMDVHHALDRHELVHTWTSEHEMRSLKANTYGKKHIDRWMIPDGLAFMKMGGAIRSMAIEVELNYKNKRRYHAIFSNYLRYPEIQGILYFVQSSALGNFVLKAWRDFPSYQASRDQELAVILLSEFLKDPMKARLYTHSQIFTFGEVFRPVYEKDTVKNTHPNPAHPPGSRVSDDLKNSEQDKQGLRS